MSHYSPNDSSTSAREASRFIAWWFPIHRQGKARYIAKLSLTFVPAFLVCFMGLQIAYDFVINALPPARSISLWTDSSTAEMIVGFVGLLIVGITIGWLTWSRNERIYQRLLGQQNE